jgi:hypothetical protein
MRLDAVLVELQQSLTPGGVQRNRAVLDIEGHRVVTEVSEAFVETMVRRITANTAGRSEDPGGVPESAEREFGGDFVESTAPDDDIPVPAPATFVEPMEAAAPLVEVAERAKPAPSAMDQRKANIEARGAVTHSALAQRQETKDELRQRAQRFPMRKVPADEAGNPMAPRRAPAPPAADDEIDDDGFAQG